jgi:hypothetical protein
MVEDHYAYIRIKLSTNHRKKQKEPAFLTPLEKQNRTLVAFPYVTYEHLLTLESNICSILYRYWESYKVVFSPGCGDTHTRDVSY